MEPNLLEIVILVLSSARITRLVTNDTIGYPLRAVEHGIATFVSRFIVGIFVKDMRDPLVASSYGDELIECPWCTGWWVSLAGLLVFAAWGDTAAWQIGAGSFALSYVVGSLEQWI